MEKKMTEECNCVRKHLECGVKQTARGEMIRGGQRDKSTTNRRDRIRGNKCHVKR